MSRAACATRTSTSASTTPASGSPSSRPRRRRPISGTIPTARARSAASSSAVRDDVELVDELERRLSDVQTLFELGARRGRRVASSRRSRPRSSDLRAHARPARAARAVQRRARRTRRDLRSPLRRGRHRRAGLGRDAAAHVHALGAVEGLRRSRSTRRRRARRPASRRRRSSSRAATRTACSPASAACTG